jgi:2-keto-4-pentenoate hydratase/2-oxohepta-3-ene-1,7-dioic acid hydratase in catechol pathway
MRLVSFREDGRVAVGVLTEDGETVVDLGRVEQRLDTDMISLLGGGQDALDLVARALDRADLLARRPLGSVRLTAPVPRPGKIICIGLNYRQHAAETGIPLPEYPVVFAKFGNTVVGPHEPIVIPAVTEQVDYEGELGVVIGGRVRDLPLSRALTSVAGYMAFNDVSARDYQSRVSQWTTGKSFDTFAPMGPALVMADEVEDPQNVDLEVTIADEVLQSANTGDMIFTVAELITYLSSVMTLEPGDVIATGTPSGVGMARTPPRWLRPGEVVKVKLSGIGTLENPVTGPPKYV